VNDGPSCWQVADFGCAREVRVTSVIVKPWQRGTLAYQAPEVLERGTLSPAADCYAFGVLLWEMLTAEA
jgi:serine/threonine protein kinase